ncbi:MAG TPA: filamentous hemagglutinin family protein [Rhizomicrobium sp.]
MFNLPNLSSKNRLLAGASFATLLIAAPAAQATTLGGMTGRNAAQINMTTPPPRPAGFGGATTPDQAKQATSQSSADFSTALARIQAQMSAQATARNAALAGPNNLGADPNHPGQQLPDVPNGLGAGGLVAHANPSSSDVANGLVWENANAPTQSTSGAQTTVTVQQNAQKAILTWDSFNVGKNTTVHFDQTKGTQSDGTNSWIALNRIVDPTSNPSQILGQIKSEGTVYLINRNGIMFGGSSQVNVHSLMATTMDLFSGDTVAANDFFRKYGIGASSDPEHILGPGGTPFFLINSAASTAPANTTEAVGEITIEAGASINTGAQGYTLLAAPTIEQGGSIVADDGEVILTSAGRLRYTPVDGGFFTVQGDTDINDASIENTGLIQARRGKIQIQGSGGNFASNAGGVEQDGVLLSSTSLTHPGAIILETTSGTVNITLGGSSVTAILPEKDGETTTSSAAADAAFAHSNVSISGSMNLESGSLIEAPSGNVGLTGNVYMDHGATIDVSGLAGVELPMSVFMVTIPRIGLNELADSPLLRDSFLYTQKNVVIDSTMSGTRGDGLDWVGSPILNASGYVENVPRTIDQLMISAGTISLTGNSIVRTGAELRLDGGYIDYLAGDITTPRLQGADGRIYDLASADPNIDYVGIAGEHTVSHDRWAINDTYNNALLGSSTRFDPGFIKGGDAGALNIVSDDLSHTIYSVLDGDISAHALSGREQIGTSQAPKGGSLSIQITNILNPRGQPLPAGVVNYVITQDGVSLDVLQPDFDPTQPWPSNNPLAPASPLFTPRTLSAKMIAESGIQNLSLTTPGSILVPEGVDVTVAPGGSINFTAISIDVEGTLRAPAGAINLNVAGLSTDKQNTPIPIPSSLVLGSKGVLDASGLWVNDAGRGANDMFGRQFINGGSVTLTSYESGIDLPVDYTGDVILQSGSLIDVSSGGYIGFDGQLAMSGGLPMGRGGNITIQTHVQAPTRENSYALNGAPANLLGGAIEMDGELAGYGFAGGGTLSLRAPQIQIGGLLTPNDKLAQLYLDPDIFQQGGFAAYNLAAELDLTVAPGTQIVIHPDYRLPNWSSLLTAGTGTKLDTDGVYGAIGDVPDYQRYLSRGVASGISLSAGGSLLWNQNNGAGIEQFYYEASDALTIGAGAAIITDPGATVSLKNPRNITVLGQIRAPGGSITLDNSFTLGSIGTNDNAGRAIWLGQDSVLDASGVSLIDPLAGFVQGGVPNPVRQRTGLVLDGGTVSLISDRDVVTEQGSLIDVSGAADTFYLPSSVRALGFLGSNFVPTPVWSDAGTISVEDSAGLFMDGTLSAHAGAPDGEGGTLSLAALRPVNNASTIPAAIVLQQSGDMLASGTTLNTAADPDRGTTSQVIRFAVDRLNGSGIDNLSIGPVVTAVPQSTNDIVVPLLFSGDVTLNLGRSFTVNANTIGALPQGVLSLPISGAIAGGGHVSIAAPYVALMGGATAASALQGDGTLSVNASMIDIGGQVNLSGIANASFAAQGDLRFTYSDPYSQGVVRAGWLYSTGDLDFTATRFYPLSNYKFLIDANGGTDHDTTVAFHSNGLSDDSTPLSAGGTLVVAASHIEQGGTIWVPSGTIQLGVSDPADTLSLLGLANTMPLVATQSVRLSPGSMTSVSLNDAILPYGTVVDGKDWNYNADPLIDSTPVAAPPGKQIVINGQDVTLDAGADIDLSGGGHLQGYEWIPGTGGTRDVLAQTFTSYTTSTNGTTVPQYADGRAVYAIVPGYQAPVAAHDGALENGAGALPALGQGVYLSGIPGLPDGVYTLLPARYATLPGAYRVVQTGTTDPVKGLQTVMADGSDMVGGYFVDTLTGKRDARTSLFQVQSAASWGLYSEYDLTSADTFFADKATHAGTIAPRLGADAGRLTLAATSNLQLGATLTADVADGHRGAEVDIAGEALQIVSPGEEARDGYVQLDADGLSKLGASSLLIGGKRSDTSEGEQVDVLAGGVMLSNDADHPLQSPEVILVAGADGDGITIESGSVLRANGSIDAATSVPLIIGSLANGTQAAVSGDGALVRVSNGAATTITRRDVTGIDGPAGTAGGALTIGDGALLDGGAALSFDVTGNAQVSAAATFKAKALDITANRIGVVADPSAATAQGFLIGPNTLKGLSGAALLRSRSSIDFIGDVALDLPGTLTLDAAALHGDGGKAHIGADTLILGNSTGAAVPTLTSGSGSLTIDAGEIDFTDGNSSLDDFGSFTANATRNVVATGQGDFDFGALDVNITAPQLSTMPNADMTLHTTGQFNLVRGGTAPTAARTLGGALSIDARAMSIGADILAPAGTITLHTTNGDIAITGDAHLDVAGLALPFNDVLVYVPGGKLSLTATGGNIALASNAVLDIHGDAAGGDGGLLAISAEDGSAQLDGTILGSAASSYQGGLFQLKTAGAVTLDDLADKLTTGGVTGAIDIETANGDLALSAGHALTAHAVTLTADGTDGGHVVIGGTVDASGAKGGSIALNGRWGVDVEGTLLTTAMAAGEKGGDIAIATNGVGDGNYNADYGYEEVASTGAGAIHIGANAHIDQSGPGGSGDLSLRLPVLIGGDINLTIDNAAAVSHSGSVTVEPYAIWSTTDTTTGAQHFDGIIDPAGWFKADGTMVSGTWTDQQGNPLSPPMDADTLKAYLAVNFFTPDTDPVTGANTDHQTFYGYKNGDVAQGAGTVMGFIQSPNFSFEPRLSAITNLQVRPGVELRNPDPTINGGNISVLTNWNLGAGTGPDHLAFRYNGQAPIITLRAQNNLDIKASITDGFWQGVLLSGAGGTVSQSDFPTGDALFNADLAGQADILSSVGFPFNPADYISAPESGLVGDPVAIAQYYGLYKQYADFLGEPGFFISAFGVSGNNVADMALVQVFGAPTFYPGQPEPPPPPHIAADYPDYLAAYRKYFADVENQVFFGSGVVPSTFAYLVPPPATLDIVPPPTLPGNVPAPTNTATNPLSVTSMLLAGGNSSSYRFVAGADVASTDPLAVRRGASDGAILLDSHIDYVDTASGRVLHAPNVIRTGTGDIDIAAAGDIRWVDDVAPVAIYAGGAPADGTSVSSTVSVVQPSLNSSINFNSSPELVVTGAANPDNGGHVNLTAGGDIIGQQNIQDKDGSATGLIGAETTQYWWQWMQLANVGTSRSAITFSSFDQGVMSVGGDVNVDAGGDILQLQVSLPTTWTIDGAQNLRTIGGGNLDVRAGGDILSGSYFVSRGQGSIVAGGRIGADFNRTDVTAIGQPPGTPGRAPTPNATGTEVATILAIQDGQVRVQAGKDVDIGGVFNPSWLDAGGVTTLSPQHHPDGQAYSAASSLTVQAQRGDLSYGSLISPTSLFAAGLDTNDGGFGAYQAGDVLPASINFTAVQADLNLLAPGELFPSATGNLSLLAGESANFRRPADLNNYYVWGMIDASASLLPSPLNPDGLVVKNSGGFGNGGYFIGDIGGQHSVDILHANDEEPVRLYALNGDIVNGIGGGYKGFIFETPKTTRIEAGRDIVDLAYLGQQLHASDISLVRAGRDIYDTPLSLALVAVTIGDGGFGNAPVMPAILQGGSGTLMVEAGRDIGPLASQAQLADVKAVNFFGPAYPNKGLGTMTGIDSVGNTFNSSLPSEGANIQVLYGVGPGIAADDFIAHYVDPVAGVTGVPSLSGDLVSFVENYETGLKLNTGTAIDKVPTELSVQQAWDIFNTLSDEQRMLFVQKGLFKILATVGKDYNDPTSSFAGKYGRGYEALNTLFPASLGYTANGLEGGSNGAQKTIDTGDLDLRSTTIQTQQGGDIGIFAPGGEALLGSAGAKPIAGGGGGPNTTGVITMQTGDVDIFTDRSVLLAQSRIFTEQGGGMTIWSSNGDINAGKGAKTSIELAPATYLCNPDGYCALDPAGQVSGAGIATLQTIPGAPVGDVYLIAPRGTVDAGDAGIRVSGDLIIAAQSVANADNIQVQGKAVGLPPKPVTNLTLTTASTAATEAATIAQNMNQHHDSTISVEVTGFGGESKEPDQCVPNARTVCTP